MRAGCDLSGSGARSLTRCRPYARHALQPWINLGDQRACQGGLAKHLGVYCLGAGADRSAQTGRDLISEGCSDGWRPALEVPRCSSVVRWPWAAPLAPPVWGWCRVAQLRPARGIAVQFSGWRGIPDPVVPFRSGALH